MLCAASCVGELACDDADSDGGHIGVADGEGMACEGGDKIVGQVGGKGVRVGDACEKAARSQRMATTFSEGTLTWE